jgi:hypothetical protein
MSDFKSAAQWHSQQKKAHAELHRKAEKKQVTKKRPVEKVKEKKNG